VSAIIVRGQSVPLRLQVHTWHTTNLFFTCRVRTEETRAVINHWTGSENPPAALVSNMKRAVDADKKPAPKSVHFAVDVLGTVYQFCDAHARCGHAKAHGANGWSVGIEFIGRGDDFKVPSRGLTRDRVTDLIHGELTSYDDLTQPQIMAGVELNKTLCQAYGLPLVVPVKEGLVYPTECPERYLETFRGCMGHLHLEKKKRDPGLTLLRAIRTAGQNLSSPPPRVA
jgi:hypothetical protein